MHETFVQQINEVLEAVKSRKIDNIYLVACGGSMASLMPGEYYLDLETDVPVKVYTSNEFVHRTPKQLGENSLVITRSHSGETPESVEATKLARSKGALTLAISMVADSPLSQAGEYKLGYLYSKTEPVDAIDGDTATYFRFLFSLINVLNPNGKWDRLLEQMNGLQGLVDANVAKYAESAEEFGKEQKRAPLVYTMASGQYFSHAYSFTSCLLMEMLWVHSNAIHAGEFFHGPFEITDYDVPFLVIRGNGATLPLDDRAIAFAEKFSDEVYVIDTNEFDYTGVDEDLREYFGSLLIGKVMRGYADALADHKGHPLSVRRYMWRMEY
ncbi:SIS domain-containing protein [Proteiniclasticum sp. QWL-01]|uniref:SIS domain-containing protein n=1 Tax=Proteiniclasticum sp. QWL-01 TaxID=3036945 RepID=UPI002410A814|nr:SIS domain-containing protein [Proteiniclasticum sp. QWL-01]WFF72205.1 SIS domain-containing protein [Proteiniclasticum sp. QWL-01]